MIKHISLFLFSLGVVEIIKYFKILILVKRNFIIIKKIIKMIISKSISDHWKQKMIFAYSINLIKNSAKMIFIITLIVIYYFIFQLNVSEFQKLVFSFFGTLEITLIIIFYIYFRKKLIG